MKYNDLVFESEESTQKSSMSSSSFARNTIYLFVLLYVLIYKLISFSGINKIILVTKHSKFQQRTQRSTAEGYIRRQPRRGSYEKVFLSWFQSQDLELTHLYVTHWVA